MEWCSESNPRKRFKKDEYNIGITSDIVQHKSILYFFIEYVWNEADGDYPHENVDDELVNYIQSLDSIARNELWFSNEFDEIDYQRDLARIDLTIDAIKSDEFFLEAAKASNNKMRRYELAFRLRKILPFFVDRRNDDVSYKNDDGKSILHIFLKEYLDLTKYLTVDQVTRLPKLVTNLVGRREKLFYEIDSHEKTPLDVATNCKNEKILEIIVAHLADVKACDENGNTALHIVVKNCIHEKVMRHKYGYLNIVRNLVSRGADANRRNKKGITAVQLAAEKFHVIVLKYFANNGADFKQHTPEDENALHLACKSSLTLKDTSKMVRTITFLVKKGCHVESYDKKGCVPLHYAAEFGSVEIVQELLKLGAKVDCRTRDMSFTPLYLASKANRLDNIMALVKAGADVNAEAADGSTPIFMSVLFGSYENMEYLAVQGADLHKREKLRGLTVLHYVTSDKVESTSEKSNSALKNDEKSEERLRKFNFLIGKNFDVNDPGYFGITPLQMAIVSRNVDIVKILIERGANVNFQRDKLGLTALHLGIIVKDLVIVEILIESGANVNCRSNQTTPLHMAFSMDIEQILEQWYDQNVNERSKARSFLEISLLLQQERSTSYNHQVVLILIENGAEVNVKNRFGLTPLHLSTLFLCNRGTRSLLRWEAHVNVQDLKGRLPIHNILQRSNIKGLKLLLKFGADINDPEISTIIMRNNNNDLKNIAIEHAIKLNVIGLPTALIYEPHLRNKQFQNFYNECQREVLSLKEQKFYGMITFYRFLGMNSKMQYHLARVIDDSDYNIEKHFQLYASVIRSACSESIARNSLLEKARTAWHSIAPVYLPDVCVEIILSNFKNQYLELFSVTS